jgi:hypothetical protein
MESRILATDRLKNIADRFAAGHHLLMPIGKLTQDRRNMNGNHRELGKHDRSPQGSHRSDSLAQIEFEKTGGRSLPSSSHQAKTPAQSFFSVSRRNLT